MNNFGNTSYSTAVCEGTAALMLSANPNLSWTEIRDTLRYTAVKINPGDRFFRWRDARGRSSGEPGYEGPVHNEAYGYGRIDMAAAIRAVGYEIHLITTHLDFNDVPEGETTARAIRFNVRTQLTVNFNMIPPGSPFGAPSGTTVSSDPPSSFRFREVYLWVTYTGTRAGDETTMADGYSVTVHNPETGREWVIPITANTIARPTVALMLSLDRSGSMFFPSGIGSANRLEVLKFSANILADVIQEGNGLGIVSFDRNPHDVLSFVGPLGPPPSDTGRREIRNAIEDFNANLFGGTAIGDGIEQAQIRLNPVRGFVSKAIIVFTDGHETAPQYITNVMELITDRVFAVGLGSAENIQPDALNALVNARRGYLLLTDELDENSMYKLAKYFLQILAGINNENIVVDPEGTLFPGQTHRIPFTLTQADLSSDVILMLPDPRLIDFSLETPDGHILTPTHESSVAGLKYVSGSNVAYYRLRLPLPLGGGEAAGRWHAILKLNEDYFKQPKPLTHLPDVKAFKRGVPYSLLVHAYSNLKMEVWLTQDHYEPGATFQLGVRLTQYGIPLETDASVVVELSHPTGSKILTLEKEGGKEYVANLKSHASGIYQYRIKVNGLTLEGARYSRELVRTAAVWTGGNRPFPGSLQYPATGIKEEFCRMLSCLPDEKIFSLEFKEKLLKQGINIETMRACLQKYCDNNPETQLPDEAMSRLKADYQMLIKTYKEILEGR
jgi:hypothetical protein